MPDVIHEEYHLQRLINTISSEFFPINYPTHWHKHVEILAFPHGCDNASPITVKIQGDEITMNEGETVFIWPGELHETVNNPDKNLIGIQFPFHLLLQLNEFNVLLSDFKKIRHITLKKHTDLAETILEDVNKMVLLFNNNDEFYGAKTLISLYDMFINLGKYVIKEGAVPMTKPMLKTVEKIDEICNYISDNCELDLALEDLAMQAGFSPSYLSRVFKKITSYNIVEYVTLQRIKKAESLLADSPLSITEIAFQSGFKSIATFNRTFSKYKGCSPRDYKKYYLK